MLIHLFLPWLFLKMTELHSFSSDFIQYQVNQSVTKRLDFLLQSLVNAQYLL